MSKECIPVQYALNLRYLATVQGLMHSLFIPMQPVYLQVLCMHGLYVVHVAAGACSAKGPQPKSALGEVQLCIISSLQESCKQLVR